MNASAVRSAMNEAVGAVFPGAVLRVAVDGHELLHEAFGAFGAWEGSPQVTLDTRWDVASLTKAISVLSLSMKAVEDGLVDLDEPIARRVPDLEADARQRWTPRMLLQHRSGLPDWRPYVDWLLDRHPAALPGTGAAVAHIRSWVLREPLLATPGAATLYSDLGYMLLGWWLEDVWADGLDRAFATHVADPLGLGATAYIPIQGWDARGAQRYGASIAPTEQCPFRGRLVTGEVHDENAFALGGIAGHAGLFSTAGDVGRWADALLRSLDGAGPWSRATVRAFLYPEPRVGDTTWRLGMDSPTPGASSAGTRISRSAVGHLGFTGCSVWIDPPRRATVVLLSNRVHPTRLNESVRQLRPHVHDLVWVALDALRPR